MLAEHLTSNKSCSLPLKPPSSAQSSLTKLGLTYHDLAKDFINQGAWEANHKGWWERSTRSENNLHAVGQVKSIPMKHKLKITETMRKSAYGLPIIPAEVDLQTNSIVGFNRYPYKKTGSFIEQKPLTTNAIGIAPVSEFTCNGTKMPGSTL